MRNKGKSKSFKGVTANLPMLEPASHLIHPTSQLKGKRISVLQFSFLCLCNSPLFTPLQPPILPLIPFCPLCSSTNLSSHLSLLPLPFLQHTYQPPLPPTIFHSQPSEYSYKRMGLSGIQYHPDPPSNLFVSYLEAIQLSNPHTWEQLLSLTARLSHLTILLDPIHPYQTTHIRSSWSIPKV